MENNNKKLMEWLKEYGMNVEFLAYKLKIDRSYIYKIVKGTSVPSKKVMSGIKKITKGVILTKEQLIS